MESLFGSDVNYGSEIQILHNSSKSFLISRPFCSNNDNGSYKLELSKDLRNGMVFKIQSKYKIRQDGESIQYFDSILIFNTKMGCYVNFYCGFHKKKILKQK